MSCDRDTNVCVHSRGCGIERSPIIHRTWNIYHKRRPLKNLTYRTRTARWGRTIVGPRPGIFLLRFGDVEDTVLNFPREESSRVAKFGGADYSFSG